MTAAILKPSATHALPAQPISEEVLIEKYAKGDERSIDDVQNNAEVVEVYLGRSHRE